MSKQQKFYCMYLNCLYIYHSYANTMTSTVPNKSGHTGTQCKLDWFICSRKSREKLLPFRAYSRCFGVKLFSQLCCLRVFFLENTTSIINSKGWIKWWAHKKPFHGTYSRTANVIYGFRLFYVTLYVVINDLVSNKSFAILMKTFSCAKIHFK